MVVVCSRTFLAPITAAAATAAAIADPGGWDIAW
eukprot:CAMPEP_0170190414 /NCGR_PEP_ID=MMETSP0040_2-20121228/49319_1 /TAXON_ID=641309 /ORGANISM="Lotharella oceanica, Strain CCMP622" /LENGTH=33 /DNA_ID= /DNA_START= /DNA_END= /DNA_ORIENTATION=